MKILLLLILFTFSLFGAKIDDFAQEMNYHRDYNNAILQAKRENKPLMLLLVTDDCAWCKKLERVTLSKKDVKKELLDFVLVIMDQVYDKDKFPKKYITNLNPTIYFLDIKKDEKVYQHVGYIKKNDFLLLLDEVKKGIK